MTQRDMINLVQERIEFFEREINRVRNTQFGGFAKLHFNEIIMELKFLKDRFNSQNGDRKNKLFLVTQEQEEQSPQA